jgi:hypothetical protein
MLAGCGLLSSGGGGSTDRQPPELVVWGDPAGNDQHPLIRDANNLPDRGVFVGSDGRVVFSAGGVCDTCTVQRAIISLAGTPVAAIRFGPDRGGANVRRPYLVSADSDAYMIQLVSVGEAVSFQKTDEPFEELAATLVIWGDPAGTAQSDAVRDVTDSPQRFVFVGTDGFVQFDNGTICGTCEVDGPTIAYGNLDMNIRFGPGPAGGEGRKPFLVSTDGFYVRLVEGSGGVMTIEKTDTPFEDPDDPSDDLAEEDGTVANAAPGDYPDDDLAEVDGTVANPAGESSSGGGLLGSCAPGLLMWAPLTALGIGLMYVGRRRRM